MAQDTACQDVYVLDDDGAVRETVARVLASEGYSAICFADGVSLIRAARNQIPHCIFLDIQLPGLSGMEVLRTLRARGCSAPVIIISGTGDIAKAVEALKAGADDYVEKPFHGKDLIERLKGVIDKRRKESLLGFSPIHFAGLESLTPREMEIVEYCLAGATSKETAQTLGLSPRTVEDHRASIMRKLNVKNVAELVRKATLAGGNPVKAFPDEKADK